MPAGRRTSHGHQRLRSLHHRHRTFELAHGGADAGRPPLRRAARRRRGCSTASPGVQVELFGSLALTGKGHGTDRAVLMGLEGETPEEIDPDGVAPRIAAIRAQERLALLGRHAIPFDEKEDLIFNRRDLLPLHSNGMRFTAFDSAGRDARSADLLLGGRRLRGQRGGDGGGAAGRGHDGAALPLPQRRGAARELCEEHGLAVWELMLENEKVWRSEAEIRAGLLRIWEAMQRCVERGCRQTGVLPGSLKVPRRAPALYQELTSRPEEALEGPADRARLGEPVRPRRQRGERGRRPGGDRAHQRRGRHRAGGAPLLPPVHPGRRATRG